jgi:lysophospholipase L1-like esterase
MRLSRCLIALATACAVALVASACDGAAGPATYAAARTAAYGGTPAHGVLVPSGAGYYVSLGDSLSQGVQPSWDGQSLPTEAGYPNQIYAVLHRHNPRLYLLKLGCSGETTITMINGGICYYPAGSQLAAAEQFLRGHRGHVSLITIDIGANDPNACITGGLPLSKLGDCLNSSIERTLTDLGVILTGLRSAGGRSVPIVAMSYYVPELAGWFRGKSGEEIAVLCERLIVGYNRLAAGVYNHYGVQVANVFGAFRSSDFAGRVNLPGHGTVPRNVATVCQWTWICAQPPLGPNEHANDIGYRVIADAFLSVLYPAAH